MPTKEQDVYQVASALYRQGPDWLTFFREILGLEGVVRKQYPDDAARLKFEASEEFRKIQEMLDQLRQRAPAPAPQQEPQTVITVRLPKSLHEQLRGEAHEMRTSMNRLCILKLLQAVDAALVAGKSSEEAVQQLADASLQPQQTEEARAE